ncbi:flagellar biosynthetic protein FliR [Paenibacillus dendritiformis]|uniref:flagellar biosynthetic protein FliR n=1 Tax=Paenibacillus dendritiformis TaxID=130049 RepID=UPI000DA80001|nr:flagellar biosynthetic protein FliR [Paenibacillus dendritiformis]PZM64025.1 flagellar biosynthetic protein FliR [Paenibacillus dendritiformis]TDL55938.1 flagellar type III secretion system protein FliR [Paenibacillus dendritiformis]
MEILVQAFPVFLLTLCRITAFFVTVPVISSRGVPNHFRVGLAFFVSVIAYLLFGIGKTVPADGMFVIFIIREVLIGLLIGFLAQLFFTAVQTAGSFIDIQIGFGIANVIDPLTGATSPVMGNFKYVFVVLLFLGMNGHHYFIDGIMRSFEWLPLDENTFFEQIANGLVSEFLVQSFVQAFIIAFQISAPLIVALFLTDVALGFLARSAPQFNIFVVGIPLKLIIGLVMLLLTVPSLIYVLQQLFSSLFEALDQLLRMMQGAG